MTAFGLIPIGTSIGGALHQVVETHVISVFAHYALQAVTALLPAVVTQKCWRATVCEPRSASFNGPWDSYMHSPASRTVSPANILSPNHTVLSKYPGPAELISNASLLLFDFGQEVGGIITVNYTATGTGDFGLAFSEASNWTGEASDGSNGSYHPRGDGSLLSHVSGTESGSYTAPDVSLRGGFRYLSVFTTPNSTIQLNVTAVTLEIAYQPTWSDLRAYGGYFYSNDDLINRIWYAGAYTLQTNAVPPNTGREYPLLVTGWKNDALLGTNGSSIFVDGSKRDRATWSGDLGIALPSVFVSTGDYTSAKNALQLQFDLQSIGELPMAGPPLNFYGSDTYHMSSIIGTYEYILHSADAKFLTSNWPKISLAINWIAGKIDSTGLLYVTGTSDWGRYAQGGHNTAANALIYRTLITGSLMANWANDPYSSAKWTSQAATLKAAINTAALNWDPTVGAFKDSDTDASVYPEDGNSLALYYDMASPSYIQNISTHLTTNWGPIGALCPELPNNIVPYVESMEIKGHLAARQASRALELMRLSWGWYLDSPYGTGSTCIEGYLGDGSFGYRANSGYGGDYSYTSHAHGWSTGPTHALSTFILGLQLTSPGGKTWSLSPQFGDLTWVEGGYTTPLGKFSGGWRLSGTVGYNLSYTVPSSTSGTLVLPASNGKAPTVTLDGTAYPSGTYDASGGLVTISNQSGGTHTITVVY